MSEPRATPPAAGANSPLVDLLASRRLLFLTGKGGVGKTTLTAALGLAAARLGLRTTVAELSGQSRIPPIFGQRGAGAREVRLAGRLRAISIDPDTALREYMRLQAGPLGIGLAASRPIGYLLAAAPGLAELLTVGRVWELTRSRRRARTPPADLVIVDAPSTGHFLALLRAPATFAAIARAGPVAGQAREIAQTIASSATGALIVSSAQEMSVSEALELGAQLRASSVVALEAVLVNGVQPQRFDARDERRLREALHDARDPLARAAVLAALSQRSRRLADARELRRLTEGVGEPALEVPLLARRPGDREGLEPIVERVLGAGR